MNDYFKPGYSRWFHGAFWGNIKATFYWIKHCWQRAFRGWADCDWWGMDNYLIEVILPMLKQLKENQHGHPIGLTSEKWDAILDRMIEGFEAGKRVIDDEYYIKTNADIITRQPTGEEINGWIETEKVDQRIFVGGMKLFSKWFFALWD